MKIQVLLHNLSSHDFPKVFYCDVHPLQSVFSLTKQVNKKVNRPDNAKIHWVYQGKTCRNKNALQTFLRDMNNDGTTSTSASQSVVPPSFTGYIGGVIQRKGGYNIPWYGVVLLILLFILYLFLMAIGFMPLLAQITRVFFQTVINTILNVMRYVLGPEDPFTYILFKISTFIQPILQLVFLYFFVKYMTVLATFLFFQWRTGSTCSSIKNTDLLSMIIAITYCVVYYFYMFGNMTIQQLRNLRSIPFIGVFMDFSANALDVVYRQVRVPHWIPIYGQLVWGYFRLIQMGATSLQYMTTPIDMFIDNFPAFMKLTQQQPLKSMVESLGMETPLQYVNYTYLPDNEKALQLFSSWKILTAYWVRWVLDNFMVMVRGFLWIFRTICTNELLVKAEGELLDLQNMHDRDPDVREELIRRKRAEIKKLKKYPPLSGECVSNMVEIGTLSGHFSLFVFFIVFLIMIIKPR